MKNIIRNILAVIVGAVIGGMINMAIISISGKIIPPPNGVDLTTEEGLKAAMHLFKPINFLMPFLAHAIGTLVGAFLAALIAANNKIIYAMIVGVLFLIGGIQMVIILPSPLWFTIVDLGFAYLPMAWLGWKLASLLKKEEH